jgi:hypothetical protein
MGFLPPKACKAIGNLIYIKADFGKMCALINFSYKELKNGRSRTSKKIRTKEAQAQTHGGDQ